MRSSIFSMAETMAERRYGLSIGGYALFMVALVLLAFVSYGAFTYSEFQRVRGDMLEAGRAAATQEIGEAMELLLRDAKATADRFAGWEEVRQQIREPRYYAYWRSYRMMQSGVLPDYVADAALYGVDGAALSELQDSALPRQVAVPPPPAYVDFSTGQPMLLIFRPVAAPGGESVGFVGLRAAFVRRGDRIVAYSDGVVDEEDEQGDAKRLGGSGAHGETGLVRRGNTRRNTNRGPGPQRRVGWWMRSDRAVQQLVDPV